MANDVSLKVLLLGEDKSASKTMKKVGDVAEDSGRKAKRASGGFSEIAGVVAGIGIADLAGQVLGFGFDTAKGMETAKIGFTTMLGSAKKADSFLRQLQAFAAKTPFEFPELQEAASSLISAGINANKVIPIMTSLGNVTSGMGTGAEGVQRATVALQQMNAAGRITGEDLNQLRDAGIPVYDLLAAATGKSKAEVTKLAQAGKLGKKELDAMMKALETGKGLERFNGLMDKQSQSLEGIISTLKDTVGQGLAKALAPLIPVIKEGIGALTDALPAVLGGLQSFGGWIADNKVLLAYLAKGLGIVGAAFLVLNAIMAANPIGIVVVAIAALVAGLLWCYDNVTWFREGVDAAFKGIGDIARWLWNNALAPALRGIVQGFAWVVDGLAGLLEGLGNIPGFEWAKGAAKNLRGMAQSAREAADGIKNIPDPMVNTLPAITSLKELKKRAKELDGQHIRLSVSASMNKSADEIVYKVGKSGSMKFSARARGGPVKKGETYLVGENEPELFTPDENGYVWPKVPESILRGSRSALVTGATQGAMASNQTVIQQDVKILVQGDSDPLGAAKRIEQELVKLRKNRSGRALAFV